MWLTIDSYYMLKSALLTQTYAWPQADQYSFTCIVLAVTHVHVTYAHTLKPFQPTVTCIITN
jgi:hypothetical protein